jgi:shikimate kinase
MKRILLIGMMGAGKTTVGTLLGERLGWPYLDSDAEIIRRTGLTVPEIFAQRGEAAFRGEEAAVLAEAATSDGPVVVAVAGGAVLDPDNRREIRRAGLVVWLRAEITTLAERVGSGAGRPLLDEGVSAAVYRLYAERRPLYEGLADMVVDVDTMTPESIADTILAEAARRGVTTGA